MTLELLHDHWVNGQKFAPGTVLDLPEPSARNLIAAGAAREPAAHRPRSRPARPETTTPDPD